MTFLFHPNSKTHNPSPGSDQETMTDKKHEPKLLEVNETGHLQELERNFSLLSCCSVGIVTGSNWPALGGSIIVAIYNGGPPGVLYEFVVVSFFYWLIAASLAVRKKGIFCSFLGLMILITLLRNLHRPCPAVLGSTIGRPLHQDQDMVGFVVGSLDGGTLSLGF